MNKSERCSLMKIIERQNAQRVTVFIVLHAYNDGINVNRIYLLHMNMEMLVMALIFAVRSNWKETMRLFYHIHIELQRHSAIYKTFDFFLNAWFTLLMFLLKFCICNTDSVFFVLVLILSDSKIVKSPFQPMKFFWIRCIWCESRTYSLQFETSFHFYVHFCPFRNVKDCNSPWDVHILSFIPSFDFCYFSNVIALWIGHTLFAMCSIFKFEPNFA